MQALIVLTIPKLPTLCSSVFHSLTINESSSGNSFATLISNNPPTETFSYCSASCPTSGFFVTVTFSVGVGDTLCSGINVGTVEGTGCSVTVG